MQATTADDRPGRLNWLRRLFVRRRRLVVRIDGMLMTKPDTFVMCGALFSLRLTPNRIASLRRSGLPWWKWARSSENLFDEVFGDRFRCLVLLLIADQVPEDWPVEKTVEGLNKNLPAVMDAMLAALARWDWRQRFEDWPALARLAG